MHRLKVFWVVLWIMFVVAHGNCITRLLLILWKKHCSFCSSRIRSREVASIFGLLAKQIAATYGPTVFLQIPVWIFSDIFSTSNRVISEVSNTL
jgi:hypothetical protein